MTEIWYSGSISESIAEAKRKNAVFVVFACDGGDSSKQMEDVWKEEEVVECVRDIVIIKVEQSSVAFSQFTQFYPVMIVPSTYVIAPNGTPLEIIPGACNKEDLIAKIKSTTKKFAEKAEKATADEAASSSQNENSLEAKTKYAQDKLDEIRLKKQAEAQAAEIEAEKRRKSQMAELSRAKQDAEDRQMRQIAEERRREKEDDRLAREAIKQKIAQDRADRAARAAQQSGNADIISIKPAQAPTATTSVTPAAPVPFDGNVRIQLRFPDGTHETTTSPSDTTMSQLRNNIIQEYSDRIGNTDFNLAVPYPRRVFTELEMNETLESLSLIPSTVLVVLPGKRGQGRRTEVTAAGGTSSENSQGFIAKFIAMIVAFFTFLMSVFTGGSSNRNDQQASNNRASEAQNANATSGNSTEQSTLRQRNIGTSGSKIHRLNTSQDDDDENNTWNGNSTQQM